MTQQLSAIETNLFLVRHGETEYNRRRIVQGRGVDVPLNETGVLQARALAKRIENHDIDVLVTSTLLRARQTAKIVAERVGHKEIISLHDLEEMSWGKYEGHAQSQELKQAFDQMRTDWKNGIYDRPVEGGESLLDVRFRAVSAINYIVDRFEGSRVLIVAHGRLLRILIGTLLNDYGLERMEELEQPNTAFNHLVFAEGRYNALTLSSASHLTDGYA